MSYTCSRQFQDDERAEALVHALVDERRSPRASTCRADDLGLSLERTDRKLSSGSLSSKRRASAIPASRHGQGAALIPAARSSSSCRSKAAAQEYLELGIGIRMIHRRRSCATCCRFSRQTRGFWADFAPPGRRVGRGRSRPGGVLACRLSPTGIAGVPERYRGGVGACAGWVFGAMDPEQREHP